LKYISGITEPVNKSTIGYFKSVVRVSFRLPVIAVLPESYLDGLTPNHLALHQKGLTSAPGLTHARSSPGQRLVGPVAELVGIEGGVVSGVFNLESSGLEARR
jgi:hypothetical protein